jgi:hypothetical protein
MNVILLVRLGRFKLSFLKMYICHSKNLIKTRFSACCSCFSITAYWKLSCGTCLYAHNRRIYYIAPAIIGDTPWWVLCWWAVCVLCHITIIHPHPHTPKIRFAPPKSNRAGGCSFLLMCECFETICRGLKLPPALMLTERSMWHAQAFYSSGVQ